MAVDSFSHSSSDVLNDLDPLSRALLDLSIQRGMDDAEIADVLGTDVQSVLEVRVGLLRSLADKVAPEHADADADELQAVIAERLYADPRPDEADEAEEPQHDEADEPQPDEDTGATRPPAWATETAPRPTERPRRRSPLVYLLPVLLVAVLAAGVIAIAAGGDDDPAEPNATQPPATTPDRPAGDDPQPRATRLTPIGGGDARGTATLDGDRLKLKLRGLPEPQGGAYEIWLYDSVIDAKSLASSKDTEIDLDVKLPADAREYEFVDVSLEPADGNPNHSGQSVLRVPLQKLEKR